MPDLTGRIELYRGGFLDFEEPDPNEITLEDVAHGLSYICRYTGQTKHFYSVAEHAVLVSNRLKWIGCDLYTQWEGLHHDNAEAFVGDVNRPLKDLLEPEFKEIELRVWQAVNIALDLQIIPPQDQEVKAADNWALSAEAYALLPSKGINWFSWGLWTQPERAPIGCYSPINAKALWLARYHELRKELNLDAL
jgi:uncharacterized protein